MKRKLIAAPRRPADRPVLPRAIPRSGRRTASVKGRDDLLLAHWRAMQQAMVATGADRR